MNTDAENHSEVSELLPWYLNGTLEGDKEILVRRHLVACVECRDDYAFLCNVDAAVNRSSPAPIVPQPPVETFMARIDAEKNTVAGSDYRRLWAMAASLVVVFLVAISIFGDRTTLTENPSRFETATSMSNAESMDYVLRIRFEDSTVMDDRASIIESFDGRGVVADGDAYRVIVGIPATSLEEAEVFTASIEARPEVRSVEIVALQLPVRNE